MALRLGDLTGSERAVLELLTVGEPLEQAELAQFADPASVDALERKGLITSRPEGRRVQVWLAHPVYGDVVRVGISAIRGQRIARSLAEVIEAAGGPGREDTLRLASLRLTGGGGSAELLPRGRSRPGPATTTLWPSVLPEPRSRKAPASQPAMWPPRPPSIRGRPEQAERRAGRLASDAVSDAERACVAVLRFDNAFFLRGRADLRLLDDVAEGITDPLWRDELMSRRVLLMGATRGPRAAVEAASTLLQRPDTGARTAAHAAVFYHLVRLGRLDRGHPATQVHPRAAQRYPPSTNLGISGPCSGTAPRR